MVHSRAPRNAVNNSQSQASLLALQGPSRMRAQHRGEADNCGIRDNATLEIGYHVIGQQPATEGLWIRFRIIICSRLTNHSFCTGLSSHGRTELASRMGDFLSFNLLRVDCTEMSSEADISGPKTSWQGSETGSPLNNYLAKHTGQRRAVFLDKFDKTTRSVRQAMLLLLRFRFVSRPA